MSEGTFSDLTAHMRGIHKNCTWRCNSLFQFIFNVLGKHGLESLCQQFGTKGFVLDRFLK